MFSNDKNIETIEQLVRLLKHYIGLRSEYVKLDVVDKVVRLLTVFVVTFIIFVFLMFILIFLSFAAVYALTPKIGIVGAFCVIAGIYFVISLLFVTFRHQWIEKPLVKFLANLLLQK